MINDEKEGLITPVSKDEAFRNFSSAILLRMLVDIDKGYFDEDFLLSEWCMDISYLACISYPRFKNEAYKKFKETRGCKIGIPPGSKT